MHRADAAKIGLTTGLTIVEKKLNIFGVLPNGKALGLGPRWRRFDSCHSDHGCGYDRRKSRKVGILCGFLVTKNVGGNYDTRN